MKIIYLHQYFKTNVDNGGTRSYELARKMVENGHEVYMITGEKVKVNNIDGIKILSTYTKYSNKMGKLSRIKAFLNYAIKSMLIGRKIKNIDLVYATSTPLTVGIPAIILKKIKRCKMIFEVRDVWPDIPIELGYIRNKLLIKSLKFFENKIYKESNKIIVLSDGMKKNLLDKSIEENKVEVITNIANLDLYKVKEENIIEKKYGLIDKFICIHPGTMGVVNGLEFILEVAYETKDKDIYYLLIGEGKHKKELKEEVKKRNLKNVLIEDALPKAEVVNVIKDSQVGIMCVANYKILEDNSANKFFDFLAAGLPIFINYKGWQAKELNKYKAGESFTFYESKKMAESIENLKNDKEKYKILRKNSSKLANQYSLDEAWNKLSKILIEVGEK